MHIQVVEYHGVLTTFFGLRPLSLLYLIIVPKGLIEKDINLAAGQLMTEAKESRHQEMKIYASLSGTLFFINPGLMRPDPACNLVFPALLTDGRPLEGRILIIAVRRALTSLIINDKS